MRSFGVIALPCFAVLLGTNAQSSTPGCFVCPATDLATFPVGNTDYTVNPFFCSYPAFPGENPNDFFCTYNPTTGALVQDNDAGFCPATAVNTCPPSRRRRSALPQSPKPPSPGPRSPKPGNMQTRSKLGVAKRGPGERAEKKRKYAV